MFRTLLGVLLLFSFVFGGSQESPMSREIKKMKFKPLKWEVPEVGKDINKIVLPSGVTVYSKENHTLPLIEVTVFVKGGPAYLPKGYGLIPELLIRNMLKGGTRSFSPEELIDSIEYNAIQINHRAENEYCSITFTFDPKVKDIAEKLIYEILFAPRIDEKVLKVEKSRLMDDWRRTLDDPDEVINTLSTMILYKGTTLESPPDTMKVLDITREELLKIHRKLFQPKNMTVSIVGDFVKDWPQAFAQFTFSDSLNDTLELTSPKALPVEGKKVYFCQRPIEQGYVMLVGDAPNGYFEDVFKLLILGDILGGGFNSKIVSKVRNELGLAYETYAYFSILSNIKGGFYSFTATRSDAVGTSIYYIFDAINQMVKGQISEEELKFSKDSFLNSTVTSIRSDWAYVQRLALRSLFGFPDDYFVKMQKAIDKITLDDIKEASKRYLKPDEISLIVVGDSTKLNLNELAKYGEIVRLNF
jgi:zinc protease|uniref:Insulinase family protein n=1 Tax=candidate division WOR-3 bacterium TaxID=2052148 RepID=A0A7V3KPI4_UNCW3